MVWSLGVLLFRMITSIFPDSSDIGLMDADAWLQPGFSDGEKFITTKEGQMQNRENSGFKKEVLMDNEGVSPSFAA